MIGPARGDRPVRRWILLPFAANLIALIAGLPVSASHINPTRVLIRVDPATGVSEILSRGNELDVVWDLEIGSDGTIYGPSQGHGIVAIDPISGSQSAIVPELAFAGSPLALAIDPADQLFVIENLGGFGESWNLHRVDPQSGTLDLELHIASPLGDIEFGNGELLIGTSGALWGFDPSTGVLRTISSGGDLHGQGSVFAIAVDASGTVLVVPTGPGRPIVEVDPLDGSQRLVGDTGALNKMGFDSDGRLFGVSADQIFQIDHLTGQMTEIVLDNPDGWTFHDFFSLAVEDSGHLVISARAETIPEPSTGLLFVAGLVALAISRRRAALKRSTPHQV